MLGLRHVGTGPNMGGRCWIWTRRVAAKVREGLIVVVLSGLQCPIDLLLLEAFSDQKRLDDGHPAVDSNQIIGAQLTFWKR